MFLAVSLYLPLSLPHLTHSRFFNGMPDVFEPGALNYHTLSRLILWILSVSRNPASTHLPRFGSLNSLLCNLIASIPGLVFFLSITCTLAVASSFLSGIFSELSTFSLSSHNPYSVYVGVNISLNNSLRSLFLIFMLHLFDFSSYLDSHCPFKEEYSSLFFPLLLFSSLALNVAKFFIPFGCIKRLVKSGGLLKWKKR